MRIFKHLLPYILVFAYQIVILLIDDHYSGLRTVAMIGLLTLPPFIVLWGMYLFSIKPPPLLNVLHVPNSYVIVAGSIARLDQWHKFIREHYWDMHVRGQRRAMRKNVVFLFRYRKQRTTSFPNNSQYLILDGCDESLKNYITGMYKPYKGALEKRVDAPQYVLDALLMMAVGTLDSGNGTTPFSTFGVEIVTAVFHCQSKGNAVLYNFKWRDLEISWVDSQTQVTMNRTINAEECAGMLKECMASLGAK